MTGTYSESSFEVVFLSLSPNLSDLTERNFKNVHLRTIEIAVLSDDDSFCYKAEDGRTGIV